MPMRGLILLVFCLLVFPSQVLQGQVSPYPGEDALILPATMGYQGAVEAQTESSPVLGGPSEVNEPIDPIVLPNDPIPTPGEVLIEEPLENPADVISVEDSISSAATEVDADQEERAEGVDAVQKKGQSGFFFVLLGLILLLVILQRTYPRYAKQFSGALFSRNKEFRLYQEQGSRLNPLAIAMDLNFVVSASIFIFLVLRYFGKIEGSNPLLQIWVIGSLLALLYFLKYATMTFIGQVFRFGHYTGFYNFDIFYTHKWVGLILLPASLTILFAVPWLTAPAIYICLALAALLILYRVSKGLVNAWPLIQHRPFHFLLYLCALEIAPIFLLFRAFQMA